MALKKTDWSLNIKLKMIKRDFKSSVYDRI